MKNSIVWIVILQIVTTALIVFGFVEREAVFFVTAALLLFTALAPLEEGVALFILSIPFFFALPFSESFDSMANWRVLSAVLFIKYVTLRVKQSGIEKFSMGILLDFARRITKEAFHSKLFLTAIAFIAWGFISSLNAAYPVAGIKKMLFFMNIFLLFPVIQYIFKGTVENFSTCASPEASIIIFIIKKNGFNKLLLVIRYSLLVVLVIGFLQLTSLFIVPLEAFWRFWAGRVIPVFYGYNLGELLQTSNTWFASGGDGAPTLRMFSVFPDSHSLAMFVMLGLVVPTAVWLKKKNRKEFLIITIGFLALIFSGSRGVWLSAVGVVVVLGGIWMFMRWKKYEKNYAFFAKNLIALFVLFWILFLPASIISSLTQRAQGGIADSFTGIKRVRSITNLEEVSNRSRLQIWKAAIGTIVDRPVFGVGPGNFSVALGEDISASRKGASAHNLYLDIASEMGLPGLLLFLLLIGHILYRAISSIFTTKNLESRIENLGKPEPLIHDSRFIIQKTMPMVFSVYFLWILGYSLFDVVLFNDKVLIFAIILVACCYGTPKLKQPNSAAEPTATA